jgi:hypothetical protein
VSDVVQIVRLAAVLLLLTAAALAATPKGRLPLALRGLWRTMRRDGAVAGDAPSGEPVCAARRWLAFLLVVVAVGVAVI